MSVQECASALKIQDAWRKYQESKDSCPICLKNIGEDSCTTKCGHKFCTGCLLKAVQRNNSCPMCRGELIKNEEESDDLSWDGEIQGLDAERLRLYRNGWWVGYDDGRREVEEEFQPRMREEIDIATQKAYDDGVVQGRSMASEDIRLLREEIDRLKRSNSRMREDLQFLTKTTRILYMKSDGPGMRIGYMKSDGPGMRIGIRHVDHQR